LIAASSCASVTRNCGAVRAEAFGIESHRVDGQADDAARANRWHRTHSGSQGAVMRYALSET